jgi:hypothetical protein
MHGKAVDVWVSFPFKFAMAKGDTTNNEVPQSYSLMRDFIRDVLRGKPIKDEQIKAMVEPEASAIAGGDYRSLVDAIRDQQKGEKVLEQANREISFTSFYLNDRRDASMMVVKTTVKGKKAITHFHTVVAYRASNGEWKIRHWHAWR